MQQYRAQNGYGAHRPCKNVLFALVAPRAVTDLYLSWEIYNTRERPTMELTCGTEYQQPCRRFNSQNNTIYTGIYWKWNYKAEYKHAQCACLTCHAARKVEFQPPIGRTHSWRFSLFKGKKKKRWPVCVFLFLFFFILRRMGKNKA